MLEVFAVLLSSAVVLLFVWLWRAHTYWRRRGIPHNKPAFFVGNLSHWRTHKHIAEIYHETYRKFKRPGRTVPFAGFYMFLLKCVLVLDIDLIKNILINDFHNFQDRGFYQNERDDPLTRNMFFMCGHKYQAMRAKMSPLFTTAKMQYMYETVMKVGQEVANVLADKVANADMHGSVMEMSNLLNRFCADVIGTCVFGLECNSMRDPQAEFLSMGRRFGRVTRNGRLMEGFMMSFPLLAKLLRLRWIRDDVHDFYMRTIKETVAYREAHNVRRNDFMDLLLELKNQEDGLSVEEVAAHAVMFFISGFETSANTLSWALLELARHPEIQDRVRNEIQAAMAKHNNRLTYECMTDMQYLNQVIQETSRMYPIMSHLMRTASQRYETSDPKYYIEKGTTIIIPIMAVHMDPDIYPEPHLFRPERFTPEEVAQRPDCAWLSFGAGPRNCIGLNFGKMQMAICLSYLLKSFKFSLASETDSAPRLAMENWFLSPEGGIYLQVEKVAT